MLNQKNDWVNCFFIGCDDFEIDIEQARVWYMSAAASGDEESLSIISLKIQILLLKSMLI